MLCLKRQKYLENKTLSKICLYHKFITNLSQTIYFCNIVSAHILILQNFKAPFFCDFNL